MGSMSTVNCDNAKSMPAWHAFCIRVKQRQAIRVKPKTTDAKFVSENEGEKNHVEYNYCCLGCDVAVGHGHFIYRRGVAAYSASHCCDRVFEQFL